MKGEDIREKFLKYFEGQGHKRFASSSLVPSDPTVLLTLAGMLQFKPVFLGEEKLKYKKVATCQKCMRMNDVDKVGRTPRHHTFFEMLGNFSFGDYFKKEAIWWAWEFLVKVLMLDRSRLSIAIYEKDDEAFDIWNKTIGIPKEMIHRLGEDNNFWSAGLTGPCGPCSEIYWDMGEEFGCGRKDCAPGCDCDRYLELWNLVFIEFNRDASGKLLKLPSKNIDTGMGLERIASVLQGVHSNFDTDLIKPIVDRVMEISRDKTPGSVYPSRVIADHIRAITHLIADGVVASNEGRGYVLRRLIRRAVMMGRKMKMEGRFLGPLSGGVIELNGRAYPEIKKNENYIQKSISSEEDAFSKTLEQGMNLISGIMDANREKKIIPGADAFRLHDTYGFPLEIITEISSESGFSVDGKGFAEEMEAQKNRARSAGLKKGKTSLDMTKFAKLPATKFTGYESLQADARVLAAFPEEGVVVLDKTPFYPEGGGQVGDLGSISTEKGEVRVLGTFGNIGGVILHKVSDASALKPKDQVKAIVDAGKRFSTANHHTSTHLLHKALRVVLGEGVRQTGSYVAPDHFRFDYTHAGALKEDEIVKIESIVNARIKENIAVESFETSLGEAKKIGAMALFGEKYGARVRVLKIGDFSRELCSGTHVRNTGTIELFKIRSDSSVAAGVRRIEAVSGSKVIEDVLSQLEDIRRKNVELLCVCKTEEFKKEQMGGSPLKDFEVFEIGPEEVSTIKKALRGKDLESVERFINHLKERNTRLSDRIESIGKESRKLMSKKLTDDVSVLISKARSIKNVKVITLTYKDIDKASLRDLSDKVMSQAPSSITLFGSVFEGRPIIVCSVAKDIVDRGVDAVEVVRASAKVISGGGGGKSTLADAGGKDPSRISESIEAGVKFITEKLGA